MKGRLFRSRQILALDVVLTGSVAFAHLIVFVLISASAWAEPEADLELPPPSSVEVIK
ncbi:MAG: hypothetical protein RBS57_02375 [Desulforhabdus sp.]|jgi:hypothetical protein|nr:hypothetical protein [Desulforhabdus sp.]